MAIPAATSAWEMYVKIITLDQRSPEWLAWRKTGIGASDAAAILGKSLWSTPQELWEQKRGLREPQPMNIYMQRGVDFEDEAREFFEDKLGTLFAPICAEHDEASFIKVSYDGVDMSYSVGLEIKVPGAKAHQMAREGYVPPYYMPQVQHQIMIGDFKEMFYGSYLPETKEGILIPVPRDNAMIDELWDAEHDFWRHVEEGRPMYTPEWAEAAAMWLACDVDYQFAKAAKEAASNRLKDVHPEKMDSFKAAGVSASNWTKMEGTDWNSFVQATMLDDKQILALVQELGLTQDRLDRLDANKRMDMALLDGFRPPVLGAIDEARLLRTLGLDAKSLESFRIRSAPIYTVKKVGGKSTKT